MVLRLCGLTSHSDDELARSLLAVYVASLTAKPSTYAYLETQPTQQHGQA